MKYQNRELLTYGNQVLGIENHGGCTLKEYRKYLTKILNEIDRICRKNDILYFLMYGTLLGAVRHNGFIPWDDDADIVMTRDNFKKFMEVCKSQLGEEYQLVSYQLDSDYGYTFAKLRLKGTTYILASEVSRHGKHAGFFVDIIILDYLSDNKIIAYIQNRFQMVLHRLVSPGFLQSELGLNHFEDFMVSMFKMIIGKKKLLGIVERIISCAKPEKSSRVIAGIHLPKANYFYTYNKYHFEKSVYIKFEDTFLPIPTHAISLLHRVYFKKFINNDILLENLSENEDMDIINGKNAMFNDVMFIPKERKRDRHLEIVFDCYHDSSYYDAVYFRNFNKKVNDSAAIKERKAREKGRKYLNIMDGNSSIAKNTCKYLVLNTYIQEYLNKNKNFNNISLIDLVKIADDIEKIGFANVEDLADNKKEFILKVMIKIGRIVTAYRLLKRFNLQKDLEIRYRNQIQRYIEVYNDIFEENIEKLRRCVEINDSTNLLVILIKGIIKFLEGEYGEAKRILLDCYVIDRSLFFTTYYLGLVYAKNSEEIGDSNAMFLEALDNTCYMPCLKLVLEGLGKNGYEYFI